MTESIDVIIPTFNRSHTLKRAIDSVLSQTYPFLTITICDDGSQDDTPILLKEYSEHPNIKILVQKNTGVSAARNVAANMGQSPWIAFLDSDDYWHPTKCQEFIDATHKHPQLAFFHCDEEWIKHETTIPIPTKFNKNSQIDPHSFFERSLQQTIISTSTVMMKRTLFKQYNGFNSELKICEDYDLWNKILLNHQVYYIEKMLVKKFGGESDQLSVKDPCLDLYRVKALANLLELAPPQTEQHQLILTVFKQKSSRLLSTLSKHRRREDLEDVKKLMSRFLF